jgi:hypothetical protein
VVEEGLRLFGREALVNKLAEDLLARAIDLLTVFRFSSEEGPESLKL